MFKFEYNKYIKELMILSIPILSGNLGQMLIGLGDVYVSGHYSTNVLAAISIASAIFMTFIIPGIGICSAITPVLSNYRGAKKPVKKLLGISVLFSQALSLLFFGLVWLTVPLIYKIGLNEQVVELTAEYIKISSFSVFGIFLYSALKEFLQVYEKVIFTNSMMILSVFLNLFLNFVLVFGYMGFPELGIKGLALASLFVRSLLAISVLIYCFRFFKQSVYKGTAAYLCELIKIGIPISGAMFVEFFGFNIVAVLVGRFEPIYAACHNIIISITSLTYMIPFSLSSALAIKTGYANGSKNILDIKKFTLSALIFILVYSFAAVTIYMLFKEGLMKIFTQDPKVIAMGASIMVTVACFTVFDGIQGVCMGTLRGLKQTLQMLIIMTVSYVFISLPVGLIFAYKFNMILEGFWLGLAFGLFSAAIMSGTLLTKRYFKLKKIYS